MVRRGDRYSGPCALVVALIATGSGYLLALTAGCGGGEESGPPGPVGPSRFVYASAYKETSPGSGTFAGGIYAYQFDPMSGGMTAVAGSPFATDAVGAPLAMSRDAKFLYSINWATNGSLLAFGVQVDGSLLSVPGAPVATTAQILLLIAHPTADFLYAIDYNGNLEVYTINSTTGVLTLQPAASVEVQGSAAAISPDGNHLYALSIAGIFEYSIDTATGALTALAGSPIPNDLVPGGATIDPSGRFMYVTNTSVFTGFGGALYTFSIDPQTGAVKLISGFSPTVGPQASVAVDAAGKYAVVSTVVTSKTGPNCFAVQSIGATSGMLSPVPGSPFPGSYSNGNCGVLLADPSGSYIYAGSGGVSVYSLDQTTGVPQSVTSSTLAGMVVTSLAVTH